MRLDWYHCPTCDVYGQGDTCWSCSAAIVRGGVEADRVSYWWWEVEMAVHTLDSSVVDAPVEAIV